MNSTDSSQGIARAASRGLPLRSLLLATALSAVTVPAFAQQQASDSSASSVGMIEEIVVTALKRATNLQETPISISAVSGETLSEMGATGIADYIKAAPGLSLVDNGPGQRRLVIRGVQGAGEAQVGLYYDETPVTGSPGTSNDAGARQPDLFLFDVDRIEVLRGPQGTLYGGGSMGGTVRVLFKKPNLTEYEGATDGTLSTTEHGGNGYKINGMINVPIVNDKLAARAVLYYSKQDGYVDSVPLNRKNINDEETWGGRFLIRAKPTENLTIDGAAYIQRTDAYVGGWYSGGVGKPYQSDYQTYMDTSDDSEIYNLTANWDIGFATLTAVTSYYDRTTSVPVDVSGFMGNFTAPGAAESTCARLNGGACDTGQLQDYMNYANGFIPSQLRYDPQDVNNWTNELRISSNGESPLNWTFGVFSEKRKSYVVSAQYKADPVTGLRNFPYEGDNLVTSRNIHDKLKQKAAFGEVSYDIVPEFTLTAGARYFDYDKTIIGETTKGFDLLGAVLTPPTTVESSENGWIFKFHAAYKPTDNILFYAQASEGFRPGGANQVIGLPGALTPYKADSLWNYEVGAKTSWLDNRLIANIAGYWIDWTDMQVAGRTPNNAFSFISNAGAARIKGIEFELTARPADGFQISWTGSYTDAKLTKDQINANVNAPGRKGDRVPYVSKFSTTVSAQYTQPVSSQLDGMLRGDVSYVGPSYSEFSPTNVFYERIDSYTLVNVKAGIENANDDWGVYLFVNNLFDKVAIVRTSSSAFGADQSFSAMPRTFGINARKAF